MALTSADLTRMSRLLDEALPLDGSGRKAWLEALPAEHQDLLMPLRTALLTADGEIRHQDSLTDLPDLGPSIDAVLAAQGSDMNAGSVVGPYRLIRELGRGGMGSVWLAERIDGTLKRQVALKLPHSNLPQRQFAERFSRECDILAGLIHTNIARLYDAGVTVEGKPWLALEYVEGEAISTWCDARKLDIKARIELFRQVLAAVHYAHSKQVIHRDLKPNNILVNRDGDVRLLDFGIAKLMTEGEARETELTQLGGQALSPQYASPEQIQGKALSACSDVYSLGVVLHELLTGSLPYQMTRGSRAALEEAILGVEPTKPSESDINPTAAAARNATPKEILTTLKGDLDSIVQKTLQKSPSARYDSAKALSDDIERHLKGYQVEAKPEAMVRQASKLLRKNRWAVLAALLLVGLAGTLTWVGAHRSNGRAAEPPAMSVTIMPFTAPANDATAAQLAETLPRELTTGLVACCRTFATVLAAGRYQVEGDVRSTNGTKSVNLRLVEPEAGKQVWSTRYDLVDLDGSFEASRRLQILVGKIYGALDSAEMKRVRTLPLEKMTAMELVFRSYGLREDPQISDNLARVNEARQLLDAVLQLDPNFVPALIAQNDVWVDLHGSDAHFDRELMVRQMDDLSLRAVTLDPTSPNAWHARYIALNDSGHWTAALEALNKWISYEPFSSMAYSEKALTMILLGRPAEALELADYARVLNPEFTWALGVTCQAHLLLGQNDQAISACEKASGTLSNGFDPSFLAAAYANHGDLEKATTARKEMLRTRPDFTIEQLRAKHYSDEPEYVKMAEATWYAGLRKAGIPEK
jgi:serine/threonine protein kinase/tetratricopeptide (TPR) repeat protein